MTRIKSLWLLGTITAAVSLSPLHAAEQATRSDPKPAKPITAPDNAADTTVNRQAKIDLNTATQEQLESLPGVGPVTAKHIVGARPFKSVNELTNISGISQSRFVALKQLVTVKPSRNSDVGRAAPNEQGSANSRIAPQKTLEKSPATEPPATSTRSSRDINSSTSTERSAATPRATTPTARGTGQKVDLNTASKEELESLPGIGPVRAQAIIDGRPYTKPEDVMKVKGIKEGIFDEIKDQVTVK